MRMTIRRYRICVTLPECVVIVLIFSGIIRTIRKGCAAMNKNQEKPQPTEPSDATVTSTLEYAGEVIVAIGIYIVGVIIICL